MVKHEKSCGAIIYRETPEGRVYLLLKHAKGRHWGFAKGHVEEGESEEQTARREIKEETGLDVVFRPGYRRTARYSPKPGTFKRVIYFLAEATSEAVTPQPGEIAKVQWASVADALKLLTHKDSRALIEKAEALLDGKSQT